MRKGIVEKSKNSESKIKEYLAKFAKKEGRIKG
jgi:hypothetical protein